MKTRKEIRSEEFLKFANELKQNGFDVYLSDDKNPTYCHFVKDNQIGYVENGDFGFNFSTVHKANGVGGTGYSIARDTIPSINLAYECFAYYPSASYYSKSTIKYKSWSDFKSMPVNQILKEIKL